MNYESLSNRELLSCIVGEDGANELYNGSLASLFTSDTKMSRRHSPLHAARELVKRTLEEELLCRPALDSPNAVKDYLRIHFMGQEYETFVVLYLDAQNRLLGIEDLFRGTLDETAVYPREVVKQALHWNAASVILAHNHPSGEPEPSSADRHITRALRDALGLMNVRVLDHLIVGNARVLSFAARGLMP